MAIDRRTVAVENITLLGPDGKALLLVTGKDGAGRNVDIDCSSLLSVRPNIGHLIDAVLSKVHEAIAKAKDL